MRNVNGCLQFLRNVFEGGTKNILAAAKCHPEEVAALYTLLPDERLGYPHRCRLCHGWRCKRAFLVILFTFSKFQKVFHGSPSNEKQSVLDCWVSVKQFSRNDTATACQDWLRSTRLGRGSIKSHVRTVKVLGMGLFAFQERVHLWKGVTH